MQQVVPFTDERIAYAIETAGGGRMKMILCGFLAAEVSFV